MDEALDIDLVHHRDMLYYHTRCTGTSETVVTDDNTRASHCRKCDRIFTTTPSTIVISHARRT
jgi:hypothetical protein